MAASKRFTTEQIVAKLREAEKLQAQGATVPAVCQRLGISEQTFYRWRIRYGRLKEDEARTCCIPPRVGPWPIEVAQWRATVTA